MFFKPVYSAFKEKIHESQKNVIEDLLDIFFFWGGEGGIANFPYVETRNES